jgi:acetyl-CoA carboxylase biotin carboxyl carrier protein
MPKELLAPLPGVFYRKPAPDKPAYKSEGDIVAVGDVVGLIEVMKSFVEVRSEAAGRIVRFIVGDEEPIVAGQSLLEIEQA